MKKLITTLVLSLISLETHAATLYTQMPLQANQTGTLYQSSMFFPDGHDTDRYVFDSFVLPSATTITELRWRGGFNGKGGTLVGFTVNIYGSNGYGQLLVTVPDTGPCAACLAGYAITGNAGETLLGTFGTTPIYEYSFILPTPFQAAAGAKYWVQIEARQSTLPNWGLARGEAITINGHMEYWKGFSTFYSIAGDTAFEIIGPNTAPVAAPQTVSAKSNIPTPITLSATDADGDPLTFRVTSPPIHGGLTGTAPNLTYTSNASYSGPDSFTFVANDGNVDSAAATVDISVMINKPPVANPQVIHLQENTASIVTLSASDTDGDPLSYHVMSQPQYGTLAGAAPNLTYTPGINFAGVDSFRFLVNDGIVDSSMATIDLSVAYAVRLVGVSDFAQLQDAYNRALDGEIILIQAVPLVEHLLLDGISVVIKGGYDPAFSMPTVDGMTSVRGSVTIGNASVSLDRISIQ